VLLEANWFFLFQYLTFLDECPFLRCEFLRQKYLMYDACSCAKHIQVGCLLVLCTLALLFLVIIWLEFYISVFLIFLVSAASVVLGDISLHLAFFLFFRILARHNCLLFLFDPSTVFAAVASTIDTYNFPFVLVRAEASYIITSLLVDFTCSFLQAQPGDRSSAIVSVYLIQLIY